MYRALRVASHVDYRLVKLFIKQASNQSTVDTVDADLAFDKSTAINVDILQLLTAVE